MGNVPVMYASPGGGDPELEALYQAFPDPMSNWEQFTGYQKWAGDYKVRRGDYKVRKGTATCARGREEEEEEVRTLEIRDGALLSACVYVCRF